jgi:(2R)-ethylmalonyl-CoA mutase
VTTGEWAHALREVFGEYRGPTGVAMVVVSDGADDVEAVSARWSGCRPCLGGR